jgi:hypothetical protein
MKNWLKIIISCLAVLTLVVFIPSWGESDKPLLSQPFVVQNWSLKLLTLVNGSASNDSILVHDDTGNGVRRIAPMASHLAPKADKTTTLTINGTPFDLSANRTWTIPVNTYSAGTGLSLVGSTFNNTAPDQTVTLTAGNRIQITGTYPNFTISYIEPTINQVSRNVNSNYTIGTRQSTVYYSVPVTATNPALAGTSVGTAFLEYSTNSGSSWTTALPTSASSTVGLAVAIALTTGGSNLLSGVIPANALVRIRTTLSGTATVGNAVGQEVY